VHYLRVFDGQDVETLGIQEPSAVSQDFVRENLPIARATQPFLRTP